MNKIIQNNRLVPNIFHLVVESPEIAAAARPGQFVIVIPDERGERIPINIADWDSRKGTIDLVFMVLGVSTRKLASLKPGDFLEAVAGPLGKPAEVARAEEVLLVGGCYGLAGLYPLARALKGNGCRVIFLSEARGQTFLYWEDKIRSVADEFLTILKEDCFRSGEELEKLIIGLKSERPHLARAVVMGCSHLLFMIAEITRKIGLKTRVNLNPIMVDGTGMCGACRVTVNGKTYFACVDGPEFDGHGVDWKEYFERRQAFLSQEEMALLNLGRKIEEAE